MTPAMKRSLCCLFVAAVEMAAAATPPVVIPKFELTPGPLDDQRKSEPAQIH